MNKKHFSVIHQLILTPIGAYNPIKYFGNYIDFFDQKLEISTGLKKVMVSYDDIEFIEIASKYSIQIYFKKNTTKKFEDLTFGLGTGNALYISSKRIKEIIKVFEQKKVKLLRE